MKDSINLQNSQYQLVYNHTYDPIFIIDREFCIIDCNNSAKKIGNSGQNFKQLSLEKSLSCEFELSQLEREGKLTLNTPLYNWQIIFQKAAQANFIIIIGSKKTDQDLSTFYRDQIINMAPGSLYWKDLHGRYLGCNQYMLEKAGFHSHSQIIGKTDFELWPEQSRQLTENDQYVMQSGETLYTEEEVFANDKTMYFTGVKAPLKDRHGEIIGIICNSLEITKLIEMQKQLEKARSEAEASSLAKSEFIANMSHDLRTPLAGIIGLVELLQSRNMEEKNLYYLQQAKDSASHLMQLLNEILQVSASDQPITLQTPEIFDLKVVVESILCILKPSIEQKKLTLNFTYDSNIPPQLSGQRILMHRILLNLISNAVKFTYTGGIMLNVQSVEITPNIASIKIDVTDTGIGIPADKQELIFEPFKRLTPSNRNQYSGVGLGLYIVKKFVNMMGGEIFIKSEVGMGTQFSLVVPFNYLTSQEIKESKITPEKNFDFITFAKKKYPLRILLVEDDAVSLLIAKENLITLGCDVITASTGREALQKFKEADFDLIFLDVGLPDLSGEQVAEEIRKLEGDHTQSRIIALTAQIDNKTKRQCLASGMNDVISKPLTLDVARQCLHSLIKQKG